MRKLGIPLIQNFDRRVKFIEKLAVCYFFFCSNNSKVILSKLSHFN